jgi:pimeloyl-ACP methyl ester carboxylesterase
MITRRAMARTLAGGGLSALAATTTRAQDFGKLLEQAARRKLQEATSPETLTRAVSRNLEGAVNPARAAAARQLVPIKTPDGWTLVAHHYPPANGQRRPDSLPVILCHGLTYSASFFDLDPSVSLSTYLASQGFDVWAIDLRGCGLSQKWVFRLENTADALIGSAMRRVTQSPVAPGGYQSLDPRYANWTLDDHIAYDVPTFVRLVQKVTGSPQVAWFGHSMGGIVALCHLARFQNPGIGRLLTVGSQVTMRDAQLVLPFLSEMMRSRQLQLAGQLDPATLAAASRESAANLFFNTSHVSQPVYQALRLDRTDVPALGLMKQYLNLAAEGELKDATKSFNYASALGNVQVPTLVTCGALDRFAPPAVQQDVYSRLGTPDKSLLIFGRASGYAADSGHDDALVGLTSAQQVYPTLARFLLGQKVA